MQTLEHTFSMLEKKAPCIEGSCGHDIILCDSFDVNNEPCPSIATGYGQILGGRGKRYIIRLCSYHLWRLT